MLKGSITASSAQEQRTLLNRQICDSANPSIRIANRNRSKNPTQRYENAAFGKRCFHPLPKTGGFYRNDDFTFILHMRARGFLLFRLQQLTNMTKVAEVTHAKTPFAKTPLSPPRLSCTQLYPFCVRLQDVDALLLSIEVFAAFGALSRSTTSSKQPDLQRAYSGGFAKPHVRSPYSTNGLTASTT